MTDITSGRSRVKEGFDKAYANLRNELVEYLDRNRQAFMINQSTTKLLTLLNENESDITLIPNMSMGELGLCAKKWVGFTRDVEALNTIEKLGCTDSNILRCEDFLEADIDEKFSSIILFPPIGQRTKLVRSEVAYIEKCLDLLALGGRLIALVPVQITTALDYQSLRERILSSYSLNGVISAKRISVATAVEMSILIIDNAPQTDRVYMSFGDEEPEIVYENYKNGVGGFFVDSEEIYDRFDVNYFEPEYKAVRELIQKRDTVKLGELANVFNGIVIPAQERKDTGDYLVIKPQYIRGGEVHLGNNTKVFCSKEMVQADRRGSMCILKTGDVLISTIGKVDWAVYYGDDDFAVANHNVAIIRGKQNTAEWLKLFFSTKTGIDYLESQLKFFSHCGVLSHISIRGLANMAVPDISMMKIASNVRSAIDLEAKVATLFKEIGWDVQEDYRKGRHHYDLALLFNGELKGVVEIKAYKGDDIKNNHRFAAELESFKNDLGDASVYLFVDDEIYEYIDGGLEQLAELPRPERKKHEIIKPITEKVAKKEVLEIEQNSSEEASLTDRVLLEVVTRGDEIMAALNRIEGKVDSISEKIEMLSKQISGYQSLVDKQLELAITPEEEERIIHAFSEECTERIIREVEERGTNKEYNVELQKLILSFGEDAWNKMDESSRTFLVSSKVMYNNLIGLQDIVDYSGVCLLVTKALEVEIAKRFCKNFLKYLKEAYPGKANHSLFPTALLDRYGKPIKPKHFTLGTVAYVLCYSMADDLTEEKAENNKAKLLEYTKEKLIKEKSDDDIMDLLSDYAESIEEVRNDYRNPSAHTNELKRVDAEQCFALVLDVEKLLKRMLDSFNE